MLRGHIACLLSMLFRATEQDQRKMPKYFTKRSTEELTFLGRALAVLACKEYGRANSSLSDGVGPNRRNRAPTGDLSVSAISAPPIELS